MLSLLEQKIWIFLDVYFPFHNKRLIPFRNGDLISFGRGVSFQNIRFPFLSSTDQVYVETCLSCFLIDSM